MKLTDDISNAFRKYGKYGDNSLECFGIDFNDGGISQFKVYRFNKSKNNVIDDLDNELGNRINGIMSHFKEKNIIRFNEISTVENDNDKRCKIYFSAKCDIPFDQHFQETQLFFDELGCTLKSSIRKIEKFISSRLSPGRSPMLMLGAEIKNNLCISLKVHFSLEKFSNCSQKIGGKYFFEDIEDTILEIMNLMELNNRIIDKYKKIGRLSSKCMFYPFLIGINQTKQCLQNKLYFRIKYSGLTNKTILEHTRRMGEYLMEFICFNRFIQLINELSDIGLFMEGFALESKLYEPPTVKTYFFPLPGLR